MKAPTYTFFPRYLSQQSAWVAHLPFGYDLVKAARPGVLVELGTWAGDSFFTFCQSVADNDLPTYCYAVDHWKGDDQAGNPGESQFLKVEIHRATTYPAFTQLLRTDFDSASREFEDSSIDFLHIDGHHTYESVNSDFQTWYPKVRSGGVILFHDIRVKANSTNPNFGVWKLWAELKAKFTTFEFHQGHGLGILVKDGNSDLEEWLSIACSPESMAYYTRRGSDITIVDSARKDQQQLAERNVALADATSRKFQLEVEVEHLSLEAKQLQAELDLTREQRKLLKSEIHSTKSSLSWKVTSPLRVGLDFLRKCFNKLKFWFCVRLGKFNKISNLGATAEEPMQYSTWVSRFDLLDDSKKKKIRELALGLPYKPLISVILPVYNPPAHFLRKAVESVQAQLYPNWELCIADDASTNPDIRPLLEKFAREDSRIKVKFREKNGHISASSNSAIEIATGEFLALLDHDDELASHALYETVALLNKEPETDFIYTDEDKIDEQGVRYDPYFKSDFLPDLLLGQNCLSHLSVIRASTVRSVGGFRLGYEGSQDWDLALRVVDQIGPKRVRHIPKVLYHWRAIEGSTAKGISEKDYPVEASKRAVLDCLSRRGTPAELKSVLNCFWRVRYSLPEPAPLVTIIIPTFNERALLEACISSIWEKTDYPAYEIIVVNNRSDDKRTLAYFDDLQRFESVRVIDYDKPFNYSAMNNFAVKSARGEVLCLLNNDVEVISRDWLTEMVSHAVRPEIGAVGAMLYYPDNTIQHAGVILNGEVARHCYRGKPKGFPGQMGRVRLVQNYTAVTAACLVVRKSLFLEVAGFEEKLQVAFNDVDFCLRLRQAGYRNLWTPFAELYHHESVSRGLDDTPEKQKRFAGETAYMREEWSGQIYRDPSCSPNLELDGQFSAPCAPRV